MAVGWPPACAKPKPASKSASGHSREAFCGREASTKTVNAERESVGDTASRQAQSMPAPCRCCHGVGPRRPRRPWMPKTRGCCRNGAAWLYPAATDRPILSDEDKRNLPFR
eukprot:2234352-Prymnesium_polylepis.1